MTREVKPVCPWIFYSRSSCIELLDACREANFSISEAQEQK
jgi:hypothetical protein